MKNLRLLAWGSWHLALKLVAMVGYHRAANFRAKSQEPQAFKPEVPDHLTMELAGVPLNSCKSYPPLNLRPVAFSHIALQWPARNIRWHIWKLGLQTLYLNKLYICVCLPLDWSLFKICDLHAILMPQRLTECGLQVLAGFKIDSPRANRKTRSGFKVEGCPHGGMTSLGQQV